MGFLDSYLRRGRGDFFPINQLPLVSIGTNLLGVVCLFFENYPKQVGIDTKLGWWCKKKKFPKSPVGIGWVGIVIWYPPLVKVPIILFVMNTWIGE